MLTENQEAQLLAAVAAKLEQLPSGTEIWTWKLVELALADRPVAREDGTALAANDITMDEFIELDHEIVINLDLGTGTIIDNSNYRYQVMGLPYNSPYIIRRPATPESLAEVDPYTSIDAIVFETSRKMQAAAPGSWHELLVDTRFNMVYFCEQDPDYGEKIVSVNQISDIKLKTMYDALWQADALSWPSVEAGREDSTSSWKLIFMLNNGTYLNVDFSSGAPHRFDQFLAAAIKFGWPDSTLFDELSR
jgi:hypothetical protein